MIDALKKEGLGKDQRQMIDAEGHQMAQKKRSRSSSRPHKTSTQASVSASGRRLLMPLRLTQLCDGFEQNYMNQHRLLHQDPRANLFHANENGGRGEEDGEENRHFSFSARSKSRRRSRSRDRKRREGIVSRARRFMDSQQEENTSEEASVAAFDNWGSLCITIILSCVNLFLDAQFCLSMHRDGVLVLDTDALSASFSVANFGFDDVISISSAKKMLEHVYIYRHVVLPWTYCFFTWGTPLLACGTYILRNLYFVLYNRHKATNKLDMEAETTSAPPREWCRWSLCALWRMLWLPLWAFVGILLWWTKLLAVGSIAHAWLQQSIFATWMDMPKPRRRKRNSTSDEQEDEDGEDEENVYTSPWYVYSHGQRVQERLRVLKPCDFASPVLPGTVRPLSERAMLSRIRELAKKRQQRLVGTFALDWPRFDQPFDVGLLNKLHFVELASKFIPQFALQLGLNSMFVEKMGWNATSAAFALFTAINLAFAASHNMDLFRSRRWSASFKAMEISKYISWCRWPFLRGAGGDGEGCRHSD